MSPKVMALRFRIWAYCAPRGWDVAIPELAEVTGRSVGAVASVLQAAGWLNRVRRVGVARGIDGYFSEHDRAHVAAERRLAHDLSAGKIGNGEHV